jgi:FemAB-related protein (PEP-CTERM system-associated)
MATGTETMDVRRPLATGAAEAPRVEAATAANGAEWDAFVAAHPHATGYLEWAWRGVFERSFGHASEYLVARRAGQIDAVLPLVEVRSWIFGHFLTSLPFVNYGGVLARSAESAQALVDAATGLARTRGCRHVELRHVGRQFDALPVRAHKVTMLLPLATGMWERLDRKVRNQVRKAEKSDLTAEEGGAGLLDAFYQVFARNMRDLGTPVYAKQFFAEILAAFPDRARLVVVRRKSEPVAAGLTFHTRATVEVPWASSLREWNSLCPNHLLYWSVIEASVAREAQVLDFGRSTPNAGTYNFKSQWGAQPVPLHWEYAGLAGDVVPDHGPTNPKFRAAVAVWKRCPLWLANAVGPRIVRAIP